MPICVVGVNHHTADVALRERLSFSAEQIPWALDALCDMQGISAALVLSTCNRTEIYVQALTSQHALEAVTTFLVEDRQLDDEQTEQLKASEYLWGGTAAVDHLFHVVGSLDSLVLGEAQIIGQIRRAFGIAQACGHCDTVFDELFRQALTVGKRIQTETSIGSESVSVATAAVDMIEEFISDFAACPVCVLGTGEMGTLVANYIVEKGATNVITMTRTLHHAEALAERMAVPAKPRPLSDLPQVLSEVDLVISSLSVNEPYVTKEMLEAAMPSRNGALLLMMDIALPRSIDKACNDVRGVQCFDLDDINATVEAHRTQRDGQIASAEAIISEERERFLLWMQERDVIPTISQIYGKAERIEAQEVAHAIRELEKQKGGELSEEEQTILHAMAHAVANKILHGPTIRLKKQAGNPDAYPYTDAARFLFGLDVNPEGACHGRIDGQPCLVERGQNCEAANRGTCRHGVRALQKRQGA